MHRAYGVLRSLATAARIAIDRKPYSCTHFSSVHSRIYVCAWCTHICKPKNLKMQCGANTWKCLPTLGLSLVQCMCNALTIAILCLASDNGWRHPRQRTPTIPSHNTLTKHQKANKKPTKTKRRTAKTTKATTKTAALWQQQQNKTNWT